MGLDLVVRQLLMMGLRLGMEIALVVRMGELVILSVQRYCLVAVLVVVLNSVARLSLNLVEELIVLMLNIVHHLRAAVIVCIMSVGVASMVRVRVVVVVEVFTAQVVVVITVTSPLGVTLMLHMVWLVIVVILDPCGASIEPVTIGVVGQVLLVVVRCDMLFAMVHHVLFLRSVRIEDRVRLVLTVVHVAVVVVVVRSVLVVDDFIVVVIRVSKIVFSTVFVCPQEILE